jgi:uncharacterized iron-regulated protein
MPRLRFLPLAFLALVCVPTARADRPDRQAALEKDLRQLEKDIAAVRGLAFKAPVVGRIIPRTADVPRGLQGYYSPRDKALFLYDDLAGNYERGVLIHEMVHALQDQHFGLAKLHQQEFGSDAELARAALIEGDATFTMIELLKKDQPRVAAMLDSPLEKAKNLRNAFLYAQGARYVQALKEKGGWEAVNAAYRFPPRATAQILFPGERFSAIDLGPGKIRGAYGIVELLHDTVETRPDSVKAAAGWRGDRVIEEGKGTAWVIAFATPEDARRCFTALVRRHASHLTGDRGEVPASADSAVYVQQGVGIHAFHLTGDRHERLVVYEAPDVATWKALQDRVAGPLTLAVWSAKEKKAITFGELADRLLDADLVCIGETHDSELNHRVQLQIVKALFARDERLGVGMEMFQRPFQKHIDEYFKGKTDEAAFLKATEYQERWGFDWGLYRPIVEFCRKNGVPVAALNARRELTRRISQVGAAGLTEDEKKELGDVDFHVKEHRDYWYERLAKMHGQADVPEERKERSYQVMTVWDEYMGRSAAEFQKERGVRRMVVLAGSGHIERGFGIPARAAKRTGGKAVTVGIAIGGDVEKLAAEAVTDFLVVVK